MKILIEFLSLRPIWTRRGLELIWYAYLVATLIQLGFFFSFIFRGGGTVSEHLVYSNLSLVYSMLFMVANLALVRIFLELALKFLIGTPAEAPR